jgi:hypothetical protein
MAENNNEKPAESLSSKQHPIPQNFMDVEFKIIGDLTMRQFIYLVAFGGPAYLIFTSAINPLIKWPTFAFLAFITFVLVFVPIDDRGADEWVVNFIRAVFGVNERVWKKSPIIPKAFSMESVKFIQAGWIATSATENRRKVEEYIGKIGEIEEKPDDLDLFYNKRTFVETSVPLAPALAAAQAEAIAIEEAKTQETIPTPGQTSESKAIEEVVLVNPFAQKTEEEKKFSISKPITPVKATKELISGIKPVKKAEADFEDELRVLSRGTPGRKFVSFSKKQAEELILPIRGEKVINIFDETPIKEPQTPQKDVIQLTKELEEITKEAKKQYGLEVVKEPVLLEKVTGNFINGVITDSDGKFLPGLSLDLLTREGLLQSSTKSTETGDFKFNNTSFGEFRIIIKNPEMYGLKFDIINFRIESYPYPPIKIVGRS